tara:strand:- start:474 stop:668 length:195 start_codon:yes stop_codon:yes gene_type:complete
MYLLSNIKIKKISEAHYFIDKFSFVIIVCKSLNTTHLPFVLEAEKVTSGIIYSYFVKANLHWKK